MINYIKKTFNKNKILENSLSVFIFSFLVFLPFSDLIIRELIRPIFPIVGKIPASQIIVSHFTLIAGFLGAIITASKNDLLSLSSESLFESDSKNIGQYIARFLSIIIVFVIAMGSFNLFLMEFSLTNTHYIAPFIPRYIFQLSMPLGLFSIFSIFIYNSKNELISVYGLFFFTMIVLFYFKEDYFRDSFLFIIISIIFIMYSTFYGMPIFLVLGGLASLFFWHEYVSLSAISAEAYRIVVSPHLATIPLFTLAGYYLAESKTSDRLLLVFQELFSWVPGGTPILVLLLCAFFTALTGGSGVTILALGGLLFPLLKKEGYNKNFSLGLVTSSGSIGLLFPPSLPLILYGVSAGVSIKDIFIGGIIPGFIILVLMSVWSYIKGGELDTKHNKVNKSKVSNNFKKGLSNQNSYSYLSKFKAINSAKWELLIPFIILFGIFSGHAKLVETASLIVVYIFIIETYVYKDLSLKDNLRVLRSCLSLIGGVLLIIGIAMGLTSFLVDAQVPMHLLAWVKSAITSKLLFLLILNIFLLIIGCVMDVYSAIIIIVPLIAPLGTHFGINPVHLAIIFIANLELGYITPPVGMNLFLSSYRFNKKMPEIYNSVWPFFLVLLFSVLLITYFPIFTLFFL